MSYYNSKHFDSCLLVFEMYTIRVRKKHKCGIILLLVFVACSYYIGKWITQESGDFLDEQLYMLPCSKNLKWSKAGDPVIGLLGVRGSGITWLRYLVEQMTGIYTGSVNVAYPDIFHAEGRTSRTVVVYAEDMRKLEGMTAGIILYRNMKDTIRSQYVERKGHGAILEAPLTSYQDKSWEDFARVAAREWAKAYDVYVTSGVPLMIMGYEELFDPVQLRIQLLKISNFLHTPIKSSIFECVTATSQDVELKPRMLRDDMDPFKLLPANVQIELAKLEADIERRIQITRDQFRPKVR